MHSKLYLPLGTRQMETITAYGPRTIQPEFKLSDMSVQRNLASHWKPGGIAMENHCSIVLVPACFELRCDNTEKRSVGVDCADAGSLSGVT